MLRPGNAGSNTAVDHKRVLARCSRATALEARLPRRPKSPGPHRLPAAAPTNSSPTATNAACSTRSGSRSPRRWTPRSDPTAEKRYGHRPTTPTASPATAHAVAETHRPARPEHLATRHASHRPQRDGRTPARNYGSPTATGCRLTAFATNTDKGQLADLELRHRHRARCEDRIRNAKDTGLRNLPFHGFDANRIWIAIVAAGAGPDRVDADHRPCTTSRPAAGNPKHYGCGCSPRRAHRPSRPKNPTASCPTCTLDRPTDHRPGSLARHLTSTNHPNNKGRSIPTGPVEPGRTDGHPAMRHTRNRDSTPTQSVRAAQLTHARSRLTGRRRGNDECVRAWRISVHGGE